MSRLRLLEVEAKTESTKKGLQTNTRSRDLQHSRLLDESVVFISTPLTVKTALCRFKITSPILTWGASRHTVSTNQVYSMDTPLVPLWLSPMEGAV